MRYVILGGNGQLGRALARKLGGEAAALSHAQADLTRPESLRAALQPLQPDMILNCAAYNFVDRAESESAAAFAVNTLGPRNLALLCREWNCLLVHYSTNYVFGLEEKHRTPYAEMDLPGPVSVYGVSKLAGEYAVRAICPRHFVIRTTGLYGHGGDNFIEKILRRAAQQQPVRVIADQFCTPTYVGDLAEATLALLPTQAYGLVHLTNGGECSWHDFARTIFQVAKKQVPVQAITTAEYPTAARRPAYSVLSTAKYESLGLAPLASWQDALARYFRDALSP